MKKVNVGFISASLVLLSAGFSQSVMAGSVVQALKTGKAYGDFNLRYETVEQDNALKDATALTLRSRLGYVTGSANGFSATLEFEDVRKVLGQDDYANPVDGKPGYSVIADPETTELDQAFIQYKNDMVTAKFGPQVITLDGHRFVGHVGWRQDRQTFDAFSVVATPVDNLTLTLAHVFERNRIFADVQDIKSKDNLINASYKLGGLKIGAYAYLLEVDNNTDNALDTYGASVSGSAKVSDFKVTYEAEFATQTSELGAVEKDADYMNLSAGIVVGGVTAKLGYEVLGSDSGTYGFSTPLATLHKFNGWSDQFLGTPAQGLVDANLTLITKVGPGTATLMFHDFSADDSTPGVDDFGSEIDVVYGVKFGKIYNAGIKYAAYSAGDAATGKVDTDKLWVWVGAAF